MEGFTKFKYQKSHVQSSPLKLCHFQVFLIWWHSPFNPIRATPLNSYIKASLVAKARVKNRPCGPGWGAFCLPYSQIFPQRPAFATNQVKIHPPLGFILIGLIWLLTNSKHGKNSSFGGRKEGVRKMWITADYVPGQSTSYSLFTLLHSRKKYNYTKTEFRHHCFLFFYILLCRDQPMAQTHPKQKLL